MMKDWPVYCYYCPVLHLDKGNNYDYAQDSHLKDLVY